MPTAPAPRLSAIVLKPSSTLELAAPRAELETWAALPLPLTLAPEADAAAAAEPVGLVSTSPVATVLVGLGTPFSWAT